MMQQLRIGKIRLCSMKILNAKRYFIQIKIPSKMRKIFCNDVITKTLFVMTSPTSCDSFPKIIINRVKHVVSTPSRFEEVNANTYTHLRRDRTMLHNILLLGYCLISFKSAPQFLALFHSFCDCVVVTFFK